MDVGKEPTGMYLRRVSVGSTRLAAVGVCQSQAIAPHIHVLSARASCFALPSPSMDSYRDIPFILNINRCEGAAPTGLAPLISIDKPHLI